jgi:hypothetical protein
MIRLTDGVMWNARVSIGQTWTTWEDPQKESKLSIGIVKCNTLHAKIGGSSVYIECDGHKYFKEIFRKCKTTDDVIAYVKSRARHEKILEINKTQE